MAYEAPNTLSHSHTQRDNEAAFVSLNGKQCWMERQIPSARGSPQCGKHGNALPSDKPYDEDLLPVYGCVETLSGSGQKSLTVRVWTTLDEDTDENFGIDNVVFQRVRTGASWLYR